MFDAEKILARANELYLEKRGSDLQSEQVKAVVRAMCEHCDAVANKIAHSIFRLSFGPTKVCPLCEQYEKELGRMEYENTQLHGTIDDLERKLAEFRKNGE